MNDNNKKIEKIEVPVKNEKKPNEVGGFYFSSFLKITDPNTGRVILEKRGDN